MLQSLAPSSSAPRTIATLFQRAAAREREGVAGTVASRCTRRTGSLCSCVNRSRSRRSGWRPSEKSSLNPWLQRTTPVRYCYNIWAYVSNGMESMYKYTLLTLLFCCTIDEANLRRAKWLVQFCWLKAFRMQQNPFGMHRLEALLLKEALWPDVFKRQSYFAPLTLLLHRPQDLWWRVYSHSNNNTM